MKKERTPSQASSACRMKTLCPWAKYSQCCKMTIFVAGKKWLLEWFHLVESRIPLGNTFLFLVVKRLSRIQKHKPNRTRPFMSVSGFDFPLWCPNQICDAKEVNRGPRWSWDLILSPTPLFDARYLLPLSSCSYDLQSARH